MDRRDEVRSTAPPNRTEPTDAPGGVDVAWIPRIVRAVGPHPSLWPVAVRQALRLAAPGWWRRRPFLPLPPADYLRFRLQTAYGGAGDCPPEPEDVLTYLQWCRDMRP